MGAAGLGGEALLLTSVGLVVGQARAAAFGLAVWIAAWALGAWRAGRGGAAPARALLLWGGAAAVAAPLAILLALELAATTLGALASLSVGVALVALAALPQGGFLPLLARAGRSEDVSLLFAANLLGGVLGARLLAFELPGAVGLRGAAVVVGVLALLAALLGRVGVEPDVAAPEPGARGAGDLRAGLVVGLVTAWLGGVEWIGFRLAALWLGGMQPALTAVLVATLLSLALGAALLPRLLPRGPLGPGAALLLAALGGWVMVSQALPGRLEDPAGSPLLAALLLVGPPLLPLGAVIPLLHRRGSGESGARLGGLLLHEVWGAALGVPLVHLLLVPALGCGGATAALTLLAVPAVLLLGGSMGLRGGLAAGAALLALAGARSPEPALGTPALDRPQFEVRAFTEDAHFAVSVVHDGLRGETTLLTDDFRATAVGDDYLYMRVLGHLPLLLHPDPERVAVLAFGTGTTAGAVARHPEVERLEVLELSRAVCDAAPEFEGVNGGVLADERTHLHLGDGRRTLGGFEGELDVLTMEPLLPDSPFAVHLYTPEFYARARRALAPGGLLCQWVPPQALAPDTFDAIVAAFCGEFEWSAVFLFGTQVILLGGEVLPALDPARLDAAPEELRQALAALGIEDVGGVAARFVTLGARWPAVARPVTDADPWVVFRPRRRGVELLADLPANLASLRGVEGPLPLPWQLAVGASGQARLASARRLHRAREVWHREEYELRRALLGEGAPAPLPDDPELEDLDELLAGLEGTTDREADLLLREVRFVRGYRQGVQLLAMGDPAGAFIALGEAGRLRPQAADVHLHAALAAHRAGRGDVARQLADEAYRLCPRLLETSPGRRVEALGLPAALLPRR